MAKTVKRNPALKEWLFDFGKEAVSQGINGLVKEGQRMAADRVGGALKSGIRSGIGRMQSGPGVGQVHSSWPQWFRQILESDGRVIPVVGARDTGKSTAAVVMAEYIQQKKKSRIFFIGYPQDLAPSHIIPVPVQAMWKIMDLTQPGDVVILDDAYRWFNSKRTGSHAGLMFEDWVNGIAHVGSTMIITVQDTSDLVKSGLRADVFVFKPPERMFEGSERPQMRPIVRMAKLAFDQIPMSDWVKYAFLYRDPDRLGMITYERPEWMNRSRAKYRRAARMAGQDGGGTGVYKQDGMASGSETLYQQTGMGKGVQEDRGGVGSGGAGGRNPFGGDAGGGW